MKNLLCLSFVLVCLCLCGCFTPKGLSEARHSIQEGRAECVLLTRDGKMIVERGRGVSPMMALYDKHQQEMAGACVVDKVIGRAAAFIAISGKVGYVHGELMSEDALVLLQEHKIEAGYGKLVPRILNRKREALCPMERAVLGIRDPEQALIALRKQIHRMQAETKK